MTTLFHRSVPPRLDHSRAKTRSDSKLFRSWLRPLLNAKAFILVVSVAFTFCDRSAFCADGTETRPKAPALDEIIFNLSMFTGKLPKNTLIFAFKKQQAIELQAGIKALGTIPNVEFYSLPEEAEAPKVKNTVAPTYPSDLRRSSDDGEAKFLLLIGASGHVSAIYCYQCTDKAFASHAAAAVVRWQFSPAKLQKTAVPVLIAQKFDFKVKDD